MRCLLIFLGGTLTQLAEKFLELVRLRLLKTIAKHQGVILTLASSFKSSLNFIVS